MFVVYVGYYAWLSSYGGKPCVTTSGQHAQSFATEADADTAAQQFKDNRAAVLANSDAGPRLLAYWRTAPTVTASLASLQQRLARREGHGSGGEAHPAPRTAATPVSENGASNAAGGARRGGGVTAAIRDWVLANPAATRADALAAFPEANPSTVGVQYGAARRAGA